MSIQEQYFGFMAKSLFKKRENLVAKTVFISVLFTRNLCTYFTMQT